MLRSRGEHQRQFRHGGKSGSRSIEQKLADLFSGRSSAWLAGCHYARTLRTQHVCQLLDLRALAAAVKPFEAYEPPLAKAHNTYRIIAFWITGALVILRTDSIRSNLLPHFVWGNHDTLVLGGAGL